MAKEISPVAKSILVLLNNVEELIRISNNRKDSKEVMKAAHIFAQSKNFPMPEQEIENFYQILIDSPSQKLSFAVRDIASKVINSEFSSRTIK